MDALFQDWWESESKERNPRILFQLSKSARKYIDWLNAPDKTLRARAAMMSAANAKITCEVEFLKIIKQVCSDLTLQMKESEFGMHAKSSSVFLLLRFEGTPNAYFWSTDNIDVIGH